MDNPRKLWRRAVGGTLSEVAEMVGCDVSLVSLWESGKRVPAVEDEVAWVRSLRELERRSAATLVRVRESR